MQRLHVIGRKNHGKTTLVAELVAELTRRGWRIATIKHTHHHHELDTPGKDSHRHRQAGSHVVGILSPRMNAVFWEPSPAPAEGSPASDGNSEPNRYADFERFMRSCDLVLVEGDSLTDADKIEVWRASLESRPIAAEQPTVLAMVTDDELPASIAHRPPARFPRVDLSELVRWIEDRYLKRPQDRDAATSERGRPRPHR